VAPRTASVPGMVFLMSKKVPFGTVTGPNNVRVAPAPPRPWGDALLGQHRALPAPQRPLGELLGGLQHSRHGSTLTAFLPSQYAIVLVIQKSIPRVAKVLLQVIPIFVGYALLGVMIFGYFYPSFGTFSLASATLFSVWNGECRGWRPLAGV
jgi:hypothetical protein